MWGGPFRAEWSEEHKQSYIRHAVREYKIHRDLDHPHIVRLKDVFEVSSDAFATVVSGGGWGCLPCCIV